jgi:hypothetical protein
MNDMVTAGDKMVKQDVGGDVDCEDMGSPTAAVNNPPRRNRPGTSARDWCKWPEQELDEMESTLAVQQVCKIKKK